MEHKRLAKIGVYLKNTGAITNSGTITNNYYFENTGTFTNLVGGIITGNEIIGNPVQYETGSEIPEFPTVALPVIAVIGLVFLFQRRKGK